MATNKQATVRFDSEVLAALVAIGRAMTPVPLNRSQMVNLAVREYVQRHQPAKAKQQKGK
jgi:hypothetical protein